MKILKKCKKSIIAAVMIGSLFGAQVIEAASSSLPSGATVTQGSASISTTGKDMSITPNQSKTWIDWQSYNVGAGHTVTYHQGAGHLTVNNVVGQSLSHIAGTIRVTGGTSILINQNGVVFSEGALIDGNMITSTLPLNAQDFSTNGALNFEPSQKMGEIEQTGSFEAHGLSVFVGPRMAFQGNVVGALEVYAADRVALHMNGDKLLGVDITEHLQDHSVEINNVTGSHVKVTAAVAEQAVQGIINVRGHVHATGLSTEGGDILLNGGTVIVEDSAQLTTNGGTIRIGVPESYLKPNSSQLPLVRALTIKPGAHLDAGAGNMFLLADSAVYNGSFNTQGGLLELSARQNVTYNYSSSLGGGSLYLDPENLTIVWGDAGENQHSAQAINTALESGSVFLEATNSITVDSGVDGDLSGKWIEWSTDHSLTLQAPKITLDGHIRYLGSYGRLNLYLTDTMTQPDVEGTGTLSFDNPLAIRTFSDQPDLLASIKESVQLIAYAAPERDITESDYTQYQFISTVDELKAINTDATSLSKNYALKNDIDIGNEEWVPIGSPPFPFTGKLTGDDFQGGTHEIQNLTITEGWNGKGLFGVIQNTHIDHLSLSIHTFTASGGSNHGGIAGQAIAKDGNLLNLHNLHVTGNVVLGHADATSVGGLIGYASTETYDDAFIISNSSASVSVTGVNAIGGLIGLIENRSGNFAVTDSYATGEITGTGGASASIGGLIGLASVMDTNASQLVIENSYATGTVTGKNNIGGLIGLAEIRDIEEATFFIVQSYATGTVTGQEGSENIGGLIGYLRSNQADSSFTVANSYATGDVTSPGTATGGLIGHVYQYLGGRVLIEDTYATGTVSSNSNNGGLLGGLIGKILNLGGGTSVTVERSHATGNVSGGTQANQLGGLIGLIENDADEAAIEINTSYSTGRVSSGNSSQATGGLIGHILNKGAFDLFESFSTGEVTGNSYVGGLVGLIQNQLDPAQLTVHKVFSLGNVSGYQAGGLLGIVQNNNAGTLSVSNAYATGDVTHSNQGGGSIQYIYKSSLTNVFSSGLVNGEEGANVAESVLSSLTYSVGADGRISITDLFNPNSDVAQHFLNIDSHTWAIGTEEAAGRVILHLPGAAIPVVAAEGYSISDLNINGRSIFPTALNEIDHYFIPPHTAYSATVITDPAGDLPMDVQLLEETGSEMLQLLSLSPAEVPDPVEEEDEEEENNELQEDSEEEDEEERSISDEIVTLINTASAPAPDGNQAVTENVGQFSSAAESDEVNFLDNTEIGALESEGTVALESEDIGVPESEDIGVPESEDIGVPESEGTGALESEGEKTPNSSEAKSPTGAEKNDSTEDEEKKSKENGESSSEQKRTSSVDS